MWLIAIGFSLIGLPSFAFDEEKQFRDQIPHMYCHSIDRFEAMARKRGWLVRLASPIRIKDTTFDDELSFDGARLVLYKSESDGSSLRTIKLGTGDLVQVLTFKADVMDLQYPDTFILLPDDGTMSGSALMFLNTTTGRIKQMTFALHWSSERNGGAEKLSLLMMSAADISGSCAAN